MLPPLALNSTTLRLLGALVAGQLVTLGLGLAIMYGFTQRTIAADARTAAEVARDDFADDFHDIGLTAMEERIAERLAAHDDRNFVVLLKGPDGQRVLGNLRQWPAETSPGETWHVAALRRDGAKSPEMIGYVTESLPRGYELLTGQVLEAQMQLTRANAKAFIYAVLAGFVIAAGVAFAIGRILERRIDAFSSAASEIAHGRLAARVVPNRTGDAFDRLASSINAMLERIEALVREMRMVTDSMAHDLRSPVARMKTMLEQAAARTHDREASEAIADAIDEADGLHRLLDTALEISRAEAGIGRDRFVEVNLHEMFEDLAEVYGPLAEEEGFAIAVDVSPDLKAPIHRELMGRALSNLVENALKYADGGSQIRLAARTIGLGTLEIAVCDDGPGIPAGQHAEALRRFGRLDPARTQSGAGLGLALVETIAHLHDGTMELSASDSQGSGPRGLCVRLTLPLWHQLSAAIRR